MLLTISYQILKKCQKKIPSPGLRHGTLKVLENTILAKFNSSCKWNQLMNQKF